MYTLLLAVVALTAAGPQFEARTVTGETVIGTIDKLDAKQVTLLSDEGPVVLEVAKLVDLSPEEPPAAADDQPAIRVELRDGSSLAVGDYTVEDGKARIELAGGQAIEVPTTDVAWVRFGKQSDEAAAAWTRILDMDTGNDLLVVGTDDKLDYHKGLLRDVTDEVVRFDFDGEVLPVKRSKIYALRYYHPSEAPMPADVCRIVDAGGSQWSVASLAHAEGLQWTTPCGVKLTKPLGQIARMDFSRGKIVYLSDLKPESVTFTPYFGTSENLPSLEKLFWPRNDKNLEGGPLQLGEKQYQKGLALHSRTKIVYRLPDRFRKFRAVVGIDQSVRPHGHVHLVIYGDDRVLDETDVTGNHRVIYDDPLWDEMKDADNVSKDDLYKGDLDLTGVRRLSILVDFGKNLDVADHLDLCNARVIK